MLLLKSCYFINPFIRMGNHQITSAVFGWEELSVRFSHVDLPLFLLLLWEAVVTLLDNRASWLKYLPCNFWNDPSTVQFLQYQNLSIVLGPRVSKNKTLSVSTWKSWSGFSSLYTKGPYNSIRKSPSPITCFYSDPSLRLRSLLSTVLRDSLGLHYNFRLVLHTDNKQTQIALWKRLFNEGYRIAQASQFHVEDL